VGCEREFRRALALNANDGFARDQFGMALAFQGRFDESIAEGTRAIALDPLSPRSYSMPRSHSCFAETLRQPRN
jgi:Flp pilus assembly protein TadD